MVKIYLIFSIFFLSGCGYVGGINIAKYSELNETRDNFLMCHGYGCSVQTYAWFTQSQWKSIESIFNKTSKTPFIERKKIALAIAKMEKFSSHLIGTQNDQAKAPMFKKSDFELDCIDETVNTSKFLEFLAEANLLKHHIVGRPAYRGVGSNFMYPHNTATVIENETEIVYVVDSYVYENAKKPDIRLLSDWLRVRIEDTI